MREGARKRGGPSNGRGACGFRRLRLTTPPVTTLFSRATAKDPAAIPLAERMRPRTLGEFLGQAHLVAEGRFLERALAADRVPSLLLWGPPGVGKTSLAKLVAEYTKAHFVAMSAVLGSVAELREIVKLAKERRDYQGQRTILFLDEIHRFHKGQQDALLPHVEAGTLTLIGATTENPSFAVVPALLSRCRLFRLEPLPDEALKDLLARTLKDRERGLGNQGISAEEDVLLALAKQANGDARRALGSLEALVDFATASQVTAVDAALVTRAQEQGTLRHDRSGDEHYAVTSAFIKALRGSDPDAALYWLLRMIDAGEDPLFLFRRMIIFASEDVGNADPRALVVVTAADEAFRRVGMPEGMHPLAQACTYLAAAPKSNATYAAWKRARELVEKHGALPVPPDLRPASTKGGRQAGWGEGYAYAHDHEGGVAPGQYFLPEAIRHERIYVPSNQGEEPRVAKRLEEARARREGTFPPKSE